MFREDLKIEKYLIFYLTKFCKKVTVFDHLAGYNPYYRHSDNLPNHSGERPNVVCGIRLLEVLWSMFMTTSSHHDSITDLQQCDLRTVNSIYYLLEQTTHYADRNLPLAVWLSRLARNQVVSVRHLTRRNTPHENVYSKRDDTTTAILARHQWECEHVQHVLDTLPNHYRQRLWPHFGYTLPSEATAQHTWVLSLRSRRSSNKR